MPYHFIRRAQVIATESRSNVLSHKKQRQQTIKQTGGCGGRVRERGEIWGVVHIKSMGHNSYLIFEMYTPCSACWLNSSILCLYGEFEFLNLTNASFDIKRCTSEHDRCTLLNIWRKDVGRGWINLSPSNRFLTVLLTVRLPLHQTLSQD